MQLKSTILLFALLSVARQVSANKLGKHDARATGNKSLRQTKQNSNSNSGGGDRDGGGAFVVEPSTCVPYDHPSVEEARAEDGTDDECREPNGCNGGCCRYHSSILVCDEGSDGGDFRHTACVCNANTAGSGVDVGDGDREGEDGDDIDVGGVLTQAPGLTGSHIGGTKDACVGSTAPAFPGYTSCSDFDGCAGVVTSGGEQTCCWVGFCYCAAPAEGSCVPQY